MLPRNIIFTKGAFSYFSGVSRFVASLKSEKFEFDNESTQKYQITGQKYKKNIDNIFYQGFYQILFPKTEKQLVDTN